ncbi:hypothetical protein AB5J72_46250 [Streptomyces sp. CG1]|uniref:hypothetical protein n=1 Tax=Streptomyces sp. CG1 TaxID=1287523 RepID=UPI0034E1AC81
MSSTWKRPYGRLRAATSSTCFNFSTLKQSWLVLLSVIPIYVAQRLSADTAASSRV